jgi:UDP-N-acetylmuramyl pentapeptide synthase
VLAHALAALPDAVILPVGERMSRAAAACEVEGFASALAAKEVVHWQVREGDLVALKGSRGMALETLLPDSRETSSWGQGTQQD